MSGNRIPRRAFLASAAATVAGAATLAARKPAQGGGAPPPLNVLLVLLDTVRADRFDALSAAGALPHLTQLAARGIRYSNAWAHASWSLPSHATILTGRYAHEHGADWPRLRLDPAVPTLASWFASQGYVAAAFSGNSNWVTPEYLGHGFLRFQAYDFEAHLRRTTFGRKLGRAVQPLGGHFAGRGRKAPALNRELLAFLDRYGERPFFAYLTYMDVNQALHHEMLNRPFWAGKAEPAEIAAASDEGLKVLDGQVGEMLAALTARGLAERTLIVVTSDHGESFGARYAGDHDPSGHGSSLYPEQSRVPLFVVAPDGSLASRVADDPVGIKAVPSTIMRLLGRTDAPFRGRPLPLPGDETAASGAPREVLMTLHYAEHSQQAVLAGSLFFLKDLAVARGGGELLFDLAADPQARHDLGAGDPRFPLMRAALARLLETPSARA